MIRIYLSVNNREEVMELPVIPPEFSVQKPQGDETFETVTGEELSFIDAPGLKSIAWDCFFPSKDYPFLRCSRFDDVWEYGYKIDMWIKRKLPIRLIISGTPINMAVKVTQFDYKLGTTGDIVYNIAFKEIPLIDTESEDLKCINNAAEVLTYNKDRDILESDGYSALEVGDKVFVCWIWSGPNMVIKYK